MDASSPRARMRERWAHTMQSFHAVLDFTHSSDTPEARNRLVMADELESIRRDAVILEESLAKSQDAVRAQQDELAWVRAQFAGVMVEMGVDPAEVRALQGTMADYKDKPYAQEVGTQVNLEEDEAEQELGKHGHHDLVKVLEDMGREIMGSKPTVGLLQRAADGGVVWCGIPKDASLDFLAYIMEMCETPMATKLMEGLLAAKEKKTQTPMLDDPKRKRKVEMDEELMRVREVRRSMSRAASGRIGSPSSFQRPEFAEEDKNEDADVFDSDDEADAVSNMKPLMDQVILSWRMEGKSYKEWTKLRNHLRKNMRISHETADAFFGMMFSRAEMMRVEAELANKSKGYLVRQIHKLRGKLALAGNKTDDVEAERLRERIRLQDQSLSELEATLKDKNAGLSDEQIRLRDALQKTIDMQKLRIEGMEDVIKQLRKSLMHQFDRAEASKSEVLRRRAMSAIPGTRIPSSVMLQLGSVNPRTAPSEVSGPDSVPKEAHLAYAQVTTSQHDVDSTSGAAQLLELTTQLASLRRSYTDAQSAYSRLNSRAQAQEKALQGRIRELEEKLKELTDAQGLDLPGSIAARATDKLGEALKAKYSLEARVEDLARDLQRERSVRARDNQGWRETVEEVIEKQVFDDVAVVRSRYEDEISQLQHKLATSTLRKGRKKGKGASRGATPEVRSASAKMTVDASRRMLHSR